MVESYINCTVSHVQYGSCFVHAIRILWNVSVQTKIPVQCQCECVPAKKKSHLSLREKEPVPHFEFVMEKEEQEIRKPYLPVNMQRSTQWALKVFSAYMKACQESGMESCPVH